MGLQHDFKKMALRRYLLTRIRLATFFYPPISPGVVRVDARTLLKFGSHIRSSEAETLKFVAAETSVPVPKVFGVYEFGPYSYILMDYIEGKELEAAWASMSGSERTSIVEQVKGYVAQLRSLKPPLPGHVCGADGKGVYDPRLGENPLGPFENGYDFHDRLYNFQASSSPDSFDASKRAAEFHSTRSYPAVFTHGDLAPRNILVSKGKVVAIIDWECAGWYPAYWEYTRAQESCWNCRTFFDLTFSEGISLYKEAAKIEQDVKDLIM